MITYLPVPVPCRPYIATVHFGDMPAGFSRGPIVLPQIWVCTSPVWWFGTDASAAVRLPPVALIGPTSRAVAVTMGVSVRFPGCGLTVRGWAELVGIPAHELTDQALDSSTLWPEPCERLLQELASARTGPEQDRAMLRFSGRLTMLARHRAELTRIQCVEHWLRAGQPLDTLVDSLSLSVRQVGRVTCDLYGLSPKQLFSKHRALRAARRSMTMMASSSEVWQEYADQSHCIREFRRFLGATPRGYRADEAAALARAVVERS